jgi:REP element-mobilizing transposase RayT
MKIHKNSQKRIKFPNAIYFVTTCTHDRFPYFQNNIFCRLFIRELKMCKELKNFKLYGFCLLYDHIHLLIEPNEKYDISEIMRSLKTNFSRNINRLCTNSKFNYDSIAKSSEGDVTSRHLLHNVYKHFKFLSGIDIGKNVRHYPKFQWQKSFHDHYIRCERDFENHLKYTVYNCQKHIKGEYDGNYTYTSLNYPNLVDVC